MHYMCDLRGVLIAVAKHFSGVWCAAMGFPSFLRRHPTLRLRDFCWYCTVFIFCFYFNHLPRYCADVMPICELSAPLLCCLHKAKLIPLLHLFQYVRTIRKSQKQSILHLLFVTRTPPAPRVSPPIGSHSHAFIYFFFSPITNNTPSFFFFQTNTFAHPPSRVSS